MVNSCNVDLCAHVYETCNQDVLKGSTLRYSCDGLQFHIYPLSPFLGGCFLGIFVLIDSVAASHLCTCMSFFGPDNNALLC